MVNWARTGSAGPRPRDKEHTSRLNSGGNSYAVGSAHGRRVTIEVESGAATITLDRPDSLNAWNEELGRDLAAALERAGGSPEVRAVMITGAGRAFSSGADLSEQRAGAEGEVPDLACGYGSSTTRSSSRSASSRSGDAAVNGPPRGRLLAGARLRHDRRRGVVVLPARLRQRRPRSRRRHDARVAAAWTAARARWRCSASASRADALEWGLITASSPTTISSRPRPYCSLTSRRPDPRLRQHQAAVNRSPYAASPSS